MISYKKKRDNCISIRLFFREAARHEASQVWENHNICMSEWRTKKQHMFAPKRAIEFICILIGPNGLSQNSFTIRLPKFCKQTNILYDTKLSPKINLEIEESCPELV